MASINPLNNFRFGNRATTRDTQNENNSKKIHSAGQKAREQGIIPSASHLWGFYGNKFNVNEEHLHPTLERYGITDLQEDSDFSQIRDFRRGGRYPSPMKLKRVLRMERKKLFNRMDLPEAAFRDVDGFELGFDEQGYYHINEGDGVVTSSEVEQSIQDDHDEMAKMAQTYDDAADTSLNLLGEDGLIDPKYLDENGDLLPEYQVDLSKIDIDDNKAQWYRIAGLQNLHRIQKRMEAKEELLSQIPDGGSLTLEEYAASQGFDIFDVEEYNNRGNE